MLVYSTILYKKKRNYYCEIPTGSSGEVVFQNVPAGKYRVRVIAGNGDAVIRSFIVLMPNSPHFCSLTEESPSITTTGQSPATLSSSEQLETVSDFCVTSASLNNMQKNVCCDTLLQKTMSFPSFPHCRQQSIHVLSWGEGNEGESPSRSREM